MQNISNRALSQLLKVDTHETKVGMTRARRVDQRMQLSLVHIYKAQKSAFTPQSIALHQVHQTTTAIHPGPIAPTIYNGQVESRSLSISLSRLEICF